MLNELLNFAAPLGSTTSLLAYIGAGADLGLIGAVVGLLVSLGTSSLFLVLYPVRALLRRRDNPADVTSDEPSANT